MSELSLSAAAKALEQWLASLMAGGQSDAIVQTLNDPNGALSQLGISQDQLQGLDLNQIYQNACGYPGVPAVYQTASAQPYAVHPSVEQVVQQIKYVNDVHQSFDDHSTNVDNSVRFEDSVDVDGDFTFDPTNVTATNGSVAGGTSAVGALGDGSAASGEGLAGASGATVIGGDNAGIAGSPGAVQAGNTILQGNDFGGGVLREPVEGGEGGGILTSILDPTPPSSVFNINTGGDQQVANLLGGAEGSNNLVNFGHGGITNVANSTLTNSAVGDGATNVTGNSVTDGGALSVGVDAHGYNHTFTQSSTVDITDSDSSPVTIAQGQDDGGDLSQDQGGDDGDDGGDTLPS
jgi:hypothetical protein